jgi:hypothetical protein
VIDDNGALIIPATKSVIVRTRGFNMAETETKFNIQYPIQNQCNPVYFITNYFLEMNLNIKPVFLTIRLHAPCISPIMP